MNTLERIEELRKEHDRYKNNMAYLGLTWEYTELLFKAFHVMREIAILKAIDIQNDFPDTDKSIDEEFEKKMREEK